MNLRRIELKTISCKGVGSLALFQRPSLSIAVSLVSAGDGDGAADHRRRQTKETPINRDDGENPEWDCPMLFDLDDGADHHLLEFELMVHGGLLLGERIVGRVRVPVGELADEARLVGPGVFRFVSYEVRAPDGKPNGTLNFGFKMVDPDLVVPPSYPAMGPVAHHLPPATNSAPYYLPPATDWPAYYSPPPESAGPLYPPASSELPPSLYPQLLTEQSNLLYLPPPAPTFGYPSLSEIYPPAVYPPATEGGEHYYNNNYYPPPPVGACAGCYPPEDHSYGHRMDAYDRRLYR